mgnify:CR=1 FL=1
MSFELIVSRSSLNEQSLERFLLSLLPEKQKLNQIYEEWAFLRLVIAIKV